MDDNIPLQTSSGSKADTIPDGRAPHNDGYHSSTVSHKRRRIGANRPRLQSLNQRCYQRPSSCLYRRGSQGSQADSIDGYIGDDRMLATRHKACCTGKPLSLYPPLRHRRIWTALLSHNDRAGQAGPYTGDMDQYGKIPCRNAYTLLVVSHTETDTLESDQCRPCE